MEKYYYISGLEGKALSVGALMDALYVSDKNTLVMMHGREIIKQDSHTITSLYYLSYDRYNNNLIITPLRGEKRESLPY